MEYEDMNWFILYNALPQLVELINDLETLSEPEIKHSLELLHEGMDILNVFLESIE